MDPLGYAISLAVENVQAGGGPFGAVVLTPDGRTFGGTNRVTSTNDPTAHAEIVAIRAACAALSTFVLAGSTIYASCEPCPMCLAAALWARLDAVVFAADRRDAASVGFDDETFHDQLAHGVTDLALRQEPHPQRLAPFEAWMGHPDRIAY